ncbi:unnamed protein product [Plutella xylostella]|uniref:(diamondback moth) hypothetical protein n=1 Tax=Plutella xylostella TaxID=51655 RepID=A0A8S4EKA4_PLUXY|nr:unnamed protein product [Plutella xylostella]
MTTRTEIVAFRTGTSTRLDDRVADMCGMKTSPLSQLLRRVYPDLYPVLELTEEDEPPRLQLTAERINSTGAYLLDDGDTLILYICHGASPAYLSDTFGVTSFNQLPDESRTLPVLDSPGNQVLHAFIERLNDDRPVPGEYVGFEGQLTIPDAVHRATGGRQSGIGVLILRVLATHQEPSEVRRGRRSERSRPARTSHPFARRSGMFVRHSGLLGRARSSQVLSERRVNRNGPKLVRSTSHVYYNLFRSL